MEGKIPTGLFVPIHILTPLDVARFPDVRGRSRPPRFSCLIYSVRSHVHDVRAPF